MSTEGGQNVCVYHVSIMGLSCTYHVTGTMGVYPAPITLSEPVGTRRHRDYVGDHWNSDHVGTPFCERDYVGTRVYLGLRRDRPSPTHLGADVPVCWP